jgi:CheY-like chemotaxis protein/anti-sigma regulatory factor (Ser/Thr protein kinase)
MNNQGAYMTETVLLVDDNAMFLSLTSRMLEKCGYAVATAADGLAAWELIDAAPGRFDLVLSDRDMPRMDGLMLLKRIRADQRLLGLPVVMLTAADQPEDVALGLAVGAYYYLVKPTNQELLNAVLRSVLQESRTKRQLQAQAGKHLIQLQLMRCAEFRFRTLGEARDMALLLAEASRDPARTVSGFLELLVNAVEHGNLGIGYAEKSALLNGGNWKEEVEARLRQPQYAERYVEVLLEQSDTACTATISDQGAGFDWKSYLRFDPARAFDLHGRGIALSKATSFDSMEYRGNGNTVVVTVNKPAEAAGGAGMGLLK